MANDSEVYIPVVVHDVYKLLAIVQSRCLGVEWNGYIFIHIYIHTRAKHQCMTISSLTVTIMQYTNCDRLLKQSSQVTLLHEPFHDIEERNLSYIDGAEFPKVWFSTMHQIRDFPRFQRSESY